MREDLQISGVSGGELCVSSDSNRDYHDYVRWNSPVGLAFGVLENNAATRRFLRRALARLEKDARNRRRKHLALPSPDPVPSLRVGEGPASLLECKTLSDCREAEPCAECGERRDSPNHIRYVSDLDEPMKHQFAEFEGGRRLK